jgi:hypothetical protein
MVIRWIEEPERNIPLGAGTSAVGRADAMAARVAIVVAVVNLMLTVV